MEQQPTLVRESIWSGIAVQISAIVAAFVIGFFLVLAFGYDPFEVYGVLLAGTVGSLENIAWSLQNTTPLIFTGLAVAVAFQAGLFNIGGEGQLVAGAFAAAVVGWSVPILAGMDINGLPFWKVVWAPLGIKLLVLIFLFSMRLTTTGVGFVLLTLILLVDSQPNTVALAYTFLVVVLIIEYRAKKVTPSGQSFFGSIAIPVAIIFALVPFIAGTVIQLASKALFPSAMLAAALAGAAWALIPAMLRAYLGVSEVINTIMFNFLASLLASYLLTTATFKEPGSVPQTPEISATANLHELASYMPEGAARASVAATQLNTGFVVALFFAALVAFILWKTTLGFELRAVGANATAAATQGIPVTRTLILAMCLSGALAGLGGAEQVLGVHHHFVKDFWQGLGFTGIAVALVGRNHPVGVVFAAMLFGALQNGAVEIDMMTLFPRELILVLQALIIFLVTSGPVLKEKIFRRVR